MSDIPSTYSFHRDLADLNMADGDFSHRCDAYNDVNVACTQWLRKRGVESGQFLSYGAMAARGNHASERLQRRTYRRCRK